MADPRTVAAKLDLLLALADFLDELPPQRFDYAQWVGEDWQGKPDLSCGTCACAMGWGPSVPALKAAGLRLSKVDGMPWIHLDGDLVPDDFDDYNTTLKTASRLFGITIDEASWLFTPAVLRAEREAFPNKPRSDATAAQVAAHIRDFVTNGAPDGYHDGLYDG